MKRIVVRLPEDLEGRVRAKCRAEGRTLSSVVRKLLRGWAASGPLPVKNPLANSQRMVRVRRSVFREVEEFASMNGLSFTGAVNELLRKALQHESEDEVVADVVALRASP